MKKLNSILTIIIMLLTYVNIYSNIKNNNYETTIEYAIKKSRVDLFNKALEYKKLTLQEKNKLVDIANKTLNFRDSKIRLDIIPKSNPSTLGYFLLSQATFCGIFGGLLTYIVYSNSNDSDRIFTLAPLTITCFACSTPLIRGIKELLKSRTFRTKKQKYWDALKIKNILTNLEV